MFVSALPTLCVTPVSVCSFQIGLSATESSLKHTPDSSYLLHTFISTYQECICNVCINIYGLGVQQTNTPNHAYHSSLVCNLTLKASKRKRALCQSHPVPPLLLSLLHLHSTLCVCSKKFLFFCLTVSHSQIFFQHFATPRLIPF